MRKSFLSTIIFTILFVAGCGKDKESQNQLENASYTGPGIPIATVTGKKVGMNSADVLQAAKDFRLSVGKLKVMSLGSGEVEIELGGLRQALNEYYKRESHKFGGIDLVGDGTVVFITPSTKVGDRLNYGLKFTSFPGACRYFRWNTAVGATAEHLTNLSYGMDIYDDGQTHTYRSVTPDFIATLTCQ